MILGGYSILAETSHRRWLLEPNLVQVGPYRESPGTVARDYLRLHYRRWNPERWAVRFTRRWSPPQPFHPTMARPCDFAAGVYLDVRSCWWTLLRRFGWGVAYNPGRYLGYAPPVEWPFDNHKIARNSLVSSARPVVLLKWTPEAGYHRVERWNAFLNIPLLHLVCDTMHLLALVAMSAGAVYVHTDGYIAPNERTAERIRSALTDLGFEVRAKAAGPGWVRAVGAYRVGSLTSGVKASGPAPLCQVIDLDSQERKLLLRHLSR
jgi:hypothetical protein